MRTSEFPEPVHVPSKRLIVFSGERIYVENDQSEFDFLIMPWPFEVVDKVMVWSPEHHVLASALQSLEPMGFAWWRGGELAGKFVEMYSRVSVYPGSSVAFVLRESGGGDFVLFALELSSGSTVWSIELDASVFGDVGTYSDICALPHSVLVAGANGRWQQRCARTGSLLSGGNGGWTGDVEYVDASQDGKWVIVCTAGNRDALALAVPSGNVVRLRRGDQA